MEEDLDFLDDEGLTSFQRDCFLFQLLENLYSSHEEEDLIYNASYLEVYVVNYFLIAYQNVLNDEVNEEGFHILILEIFMIPEGH